MQNSQTKNKKGRNTLEERRQAVLEVALVSAGHDGWTEELLQKSAKQAGLDTHDLHLAFPDGVGALLNYFCQRGDDEAAVLLAQAGLDDMRIREKITFGVRTRLDVDQDHKAAVRAAVAAFARPAHMSEGASALYRTADCLWQAAGDQALDYNRYTKRLILSGVYSATLMVWLSDTSEEHSKTWTFLDNRIEGVMRFEKTKAQVTNLFKNWTSSKPRRD